MITKSRATGSKTHATWPILNITNCDKQVIVIWCDGRNGVRKDIYPNFILLIASKPPHIWVKVSAKIGCSSVVHYQSRGVQPAIRMHPKPYMGQKKPQSKNWSTEAAASLGRCTWAEPGQRWQGNWENKVKTQRIGQKDFQVKQKSPPPPLCPTPDPIHMLRSPLWNWWLLG